jgi:hypothetical protein
MPGDLADGLATAAQQSQDLSARRIGECRRSVLALLLLARTKRGRFAYIAQPPAHFHRNDVTIIYETVH